MKKAILICTFCAALLLTGCTDSADTENIIDESGTAAVTSAEAVTEKQFTSYTTTITDGKDRYLLTLERSENGLSAVLEDNTYKAQHTEIAAPSGYTIVYPLSDITAGNVFKVITNDIDSSQTVPDIIKISFTDEKETVSRLYSISGGQLKEISISDDDEPVSCLPAYSMYHSEADKFIGSIVISEGALTDDISTAARIKTFVFDSSAMTLKSGYEELTEENTLYFGYAYWGLANNTAKYFTESTFNIADRDNYAEQSGKYYFRISDERFSDMEGLKGYLCGIFTETAADKLIEHSAQSYCDIDGELYGTSEKFRRSQQLGMLTFTGYEISEDGNKITYHTRQETYTEHGIFNGYCDGGDFTIVKDGSRWLVEEYRYPYS